MVVVGPTWYNQWCYWSSAEDHVGEDEEISKVKMNKPDPSNEREDDLGGHEIDIEKAPYQVSYGDICGAVLIHWSWAITVAHCGTEVTFIRLGSKYRLKGYKVQIDKHVLHPLYGRKPEFDHDVQLLLLEEPLKPSRTVNVIDISDGAHGGYVYVTGWGHAAEKGDYTNALQKVRINIVDMDRCQKVSQSRYNHTLTSRMFCAGGGRRDACQGDSGGAAVSYSRLVGLSSFGHGCGRHVPGVYTNVSSPNIRVWIRRNVGI